MVRIVWQKALFAAVITISFWWKYIPQCGKGHLKLPYQYEWIATRSCAKTCRSFSSSDCVWQVNCFLNTYIHTQTIWWCTWTKEQAPPCWISLDRLGILWKYILLKKNKYSVEILAVTWNLTGRSTRWWAHSGIKALEEHFQTLSWCQCRIGPLPRKDGNNLSKQASISGTVWGESDC